MHAMLDVALMPFRLALDYALPPRCPGCGTITPRDGIFCDGCWRTLDFLGGPACARCGEPFAQDLGPDTLCGACLADPPALDGVRAAVAYGEIPAALAIRLKHGGRPGLARTLAHHMRRLVHGAEDGLLIPVPLHRWRLWRRGYNQALLIARALARDAGMDLAPDLLRRTRATPLLRGMGPAQRRKTVQGAFRIDPRQAERVRGRAVLLVDDVYTTGATVNACARVLKRAGASRVQLCCWARVIRDIDNAHPR